MRARQPRYWRISTDHDVRWAFEEGDTLQFGRVHGSFALGDKPPEEFIRGHFGERARFVEPELPIGSYYPRMWRPDFCPPPSGVDVEHCASSARAARALFLRLRELFMYIEPVRGSNLRAYGHESRMLLILACTEVESACKAVLRANGYARAGQWKTKDFVQLLEPMRLSEWSVLPNVAPSIGLLSPFKGWDASNPTKSLPWYEAYNAVKHDREANFPEATVERAVQAVAAVYVLFCAQFGTWAPRGDHFSDLKILQSVNAAEVNAGTADFRISDTPTFPDELLYAPPSILGGSTWIPVKYFEDTSDSSG